MPGAVPTQGNAGTAAASAAITASVAAVTASPGSHRRCVVRHQHPARFSGPSEDLLVSGARKLRLLHPNDVHVRNSMTEGANDMVVSLALETKDATGA